MSTFYTAIPPIERITQITQLDYYYDVPADWHIALTDVQGSTVAIQQGKYKDVNAIAAASIAGMLNVVEDREIPFVFGGDGATMLVPPDVLPQARGVLIATQRLAASQFGLTLRIGTVPVADVLRDGLRIRVARLRMSDNFQQAIFAGGGLAYAEKLLKDPLRGAAYRVDDDGGAYTGNFAGFECRWNAIPSPSEETVSLMVSAVRGDTSGYTQVYDDVLRAIEAIYGDSEARRPITVANLSMALNPNALKIEAKVRHQDTGSGQLLRMLRGSLMAWVAMLFNIRGWGRYKSILVGALDTEKFDDTLRMIVSGTRAQRDALRAYLEEQRAAGDLVYGIHASQHALMTCLVFDYFGKQVHFVDASDGGYALAALEMKAQLKAKEG